MSDHAYIATFRGVQLGFEMFSYSPQPKAMSPRITQLFRSPVASLIRPTTGRYVEHMVTCHVKATDAIEVADLIESYGELMDDAPGDLVITQGLNTPEERRRITDAYLIDINAEDRREPARAFLTPVTFQFVTNQPAT